MNTKIERQGKGHAIFIDGIQVQWVIGSRRNAEKEAAKRVKTLNNLFGIKEYNYEN